MTPRDSTPPRSAERQYVKFIPPSESNSSAIARQKNINIYTAENKYLIGRPSKTRFSARKNLYKHSRTPASKPIHHKRLCRQVFKNGQETQKFATSCAIKHLK